MREIKCNYNSEEIADMLFDNRNKHVHVTGMSVIDQFDVPIRMDCIDAVSVLDLSPARIEEFECQGVKYKLISPLVLKPMHSEDRQIITVKNEALGINLYALTREELNELIDWEMSDLWINYVLEDDSVLDEKAKQIKHNLKALVEEQAR